MSTIGQIKDLLAHCTDAERSELFRELRKHNPIHGLEADWNVTAEVVLEAIHRSGPLTQRMFRGILAEAAFKVEVLEKHPQIEDITTPGDHPYDFKIKSGAQEIGIQVKLQRSEKMTPMTADQIRGLGRADQFVVEVQKTRAGKNATGEDTRPYRFGEFEILAVAMKPITGNWSSFVYTLERWLIPRMDNPSQIQIYQPVDLHPNEDWTDDLQTALEWYRSDLSRCITGGQTSRRRR